MKTIKLGDPQPDPCENCGLLYGYQVTDNVRLGYTYAYDNDGDSDGGFYSEYSNTTKKGVRAFCRSCRADLKLKVDRSED